MNQKEKNSQKDSGHSQLSPSKRFLGGLITVLTHHTKNAYNATLTRASEFLHELGIGKRSRKVVYALITVVFIGYNLLTMEQSFEAIPISKLDADNTYSGADGTHRGCEHQDDVQCKAVDSSEVRSGLNDLFNDGLDGNVVFIDSII